MTSVPAVARTFVTNGANRHENPAEKEPERVQVVKSGTSPRPIFVENDPFRIRTVCGGVDSRSLGQVTRSHASSPPSLPSPQTPLTAP